MIEEIEEEEERVHLHVHLDPLVIRIEPYHRPGQPVTAILTIGGSLMPAEISIDDQNGVVQLNWIDDKGDPDALEPEGAQVAFASDNPLVATVDPQTGLITPLAEGSANATVTITDAAGQPLLEPDGVTPFAAGPAPFQVVAGAATSAGLAVKA